MLCNTELLTKPVVEIIDDLSVKNPVLLDCYSRIKGKLKNFCKFKGIKFAELKLFDLYDSDNSINRDLKRFIMHIPKPDDRSDIRHGEFKFEISTRLNQLLRLVVGDNSSDSILLKRESYIESSVPEFLISVIKVLPKVYSFQKNLKYSKNQGEELSLSENSRHVLTVLLKVIGEFGTNNIHQLLIDNNSNINKTISEIISFNKAGSVRACVSVLRKKLGIKLPAKVKASANLCDLPPTLRNQFEMFEKRAPVGWVDSPFMISLAAHNGITIKPLEEKTIETYREALLQAVPHIAYKDDLDVRDLLKLESSLVMVDEVQTTKLCNSLIDDYRKFELNKETKKKRKGFDSTQFSHFICCIKAIASYNGIFHLQSVFSRQYVIRLDRETRRKFKRDKKKIFPLKMIDQVILELESRFNKIIRSKGYVYNPSIRKRSETHNNLRFCFFYISFITLRFTGFRQQSVRDCVYGENIIFDQDGSITFRWDPDKIKNDKYYEMILDPNNHSETHGVLIRGLTLYHNTLYKYIQRLYRNSINNQFFLKLNDKRQIQNFESTRPEDFYNHFVYSLYSFVDNQLLANELKLTLKVHDFRHLAADWYFDKFNRNIDLTANVLGDSPSTIAQEYLRNDQHIVTADLDELNNIALSRKKNTIEYKMHDKIDYLEEALEKALKRAEVSESLVIKLQLMIDNLNNLFTNIQRGNTSQIE